MEYSFDAAQGEGGSADANDLQVRESEEHLIASHAFLLVLLPPLPTC